MSAVELIRAVSQVTWILLALIALARVFSRPSRANVDLAFFFGGLGLVTLLGRVEDVLPAAEPTLGLIQRPIVMALPYALLRLAHDFGAVPSRVRRAAELGLVVGVLGVTVFPDLPPPVILYVVAYFALVAGYSASSFIRLAARSHGVTRRRMRAVAWGSYLLGIAVLMAGGGVILAALEPITDVATQLLALASSLSYAVGFAPPTPLRAYWRLPDLREFGRRIVELPRLPTTAAIVDELERLCGMAFGATAAIGLWDASRGALRFRAPGEDRLDGVGPSAYVASRVFEAQRPRFFRDAAEADPAHAEEYRRAGVGPVLVAPITAGDRRIGVLAVYASREPIFEEDDLELLVLLAQQSAVVLEARVLIDQAAEVRAREEATRLKEDFVSAAAHDLRTPLTTIVAQAQLLELRAQQEGRDSEAAGLQRLVRETGRLARLVDELLDASRLERGALSIHRERADVAEIARSIGLRERHGSGRIEIAAAVVGLYDPDRIAQLVDNLLDNALKYSSEDSRVWLRVWREGGTARVAVTDQGIGIPAEEVPHVFDRFWRGPNVDHRRFAGIGLGLYICRGIVERHGGRIWVESAPGQGSTFHVALPDAEGDAAAGPAP